MLHLLEPLDSKKSFELLTNRIFSFDTNSWENASSDLDIGKEIVERCDGIPVASVLIAACEGQERELKHTWNSCHDLNLGLSIKY